MTHAEMDELYDLFALGAVEPEASAEIERHLAEGCTYCREHVADAAVFAAALAGIVEEKPLPRDLRARVLAQIAPQPARRPAKSWMWAIAALSAACLALLIYSASAREDANRMREEIAGLREQVVALRAEREQLAATRIERNQLRAALAIMNRPDTRTGQVGATNAPHARVFVNGRGGLIFIGGDLPRVPETRTLELWVVPKTGNPRAAGLFRANTAGESVHISPIAVDPSATKALAVSVEPREGSSAPTTTPFLIVPIQ